MKVIKYKINGKEVEIEVSDKFAKAYEKLAKEERKNYRKETRRSISLDNMLDKGIDFESDDLNPEEKVIQEERGSEILEALSSLDKDEMAILKAIAENEFNFQSYAEEQDISIHAAYKRVARLKEKAQKLIKDSNIL